MPSRRLSFYVQKFCNANPERLAVREPDLRIVSSKQRIVERITNHFLNNPGFPPQSNPSVAEWCDTDFESSVLGKEPHTWLWVASKIQAIETTMTRLMSNFNRECQRRMQFSLSQRHVQCVHGRRAEVRIRRQGRLGGSHSVTLLKAISIQTVMNASCSK
jgi:hypothetical protein